MDYANQTPIVANAARLLKDAKLLADHERYASRDHARERTIGYVLTHWHGEARRDLALGGRSGGGVEGLNGRGDSGAYAPSLR